MSGSELRYMLKERVSLPERKLVTGSVHVMGRFSCYPSSQNHTQSCTPCTVPLTYLPTRVRAAPTSLRTAYSNWRSLAYFDSPAHLYAPKSSASPLLLHISQVTQLDADTCSLVSNTPLITHTDTITRPHSRDVKVLAGGSRKVDANSGSTQRRQRSGVRESEAAILRDRMQVCG